MGENPITKPIRPLFAQALKAKGIICPLVFFRSTVEGRGGKPKPKPKPIRLFFKRGGATIKAGYPGLIVHGLRRTAIRNIVREGIPELVAMKPSGHLTPSVFGRYDIVSGSDLIDAARGLDNAASR